MQSTRSKKKVHASTTAGEASRQVKDRKPEKYRYRGRVRTGCITCRTRKIKCDEGQPSCSKCAKASVQCVYKPIKRLHRHSDASATEDGSRRAALTAAAAPLASDVQQAISALSRKVYQSPTMPSSLAELISQDIQITTTMDLLAVGNPESLAYFLDELQFPMISVYDRTGWTKAKTYVVELAQTSHVVMATAHALQMLHKSQRYGLPLAGALSLYASAKDGMETYARAIRNPVDCIIAAAFCLAVFDAIRCEPVSILREPTDAIIGRFRQWHGLRQQSPHLIRMGLWLRLMHIGASRGGGPGLASKEILSFLPPDCESLPQRRPSVRDIERHQESLFRFYFDIQMVATDLLPLSHYARSRITQSDQIEARELLDVLTQRLEDLWGMRPECIMLRPDELRRQLATSQPEVVDSVITLAGVVMAEYHGQHIEICRAISNPPRVDATVNKACAGIRHVVESGWNSVQHDGKLSCGYLRPLLQYAIECFGIEETQWAVSRIESIQDPICRSDFFATYAKQLSEAQIAEDRRVTMKYFCLRVFGSPLPFY